MDKFQNLNKVKLILVVTCVIKYFLWTGFFILQGRAIEQAVNRVVLINQLLVTLGLFIFIKLLVMFLDIVSKHLVNYFQNIAIENKWRQIFPLKIYRDNEHQNHAFNLLIFDYFPNLYSTECAIFNNVALIASVSVISTALLMYTHFYIGFAALALVFTLNFFNKTIYRKHIEKSHKESHIKKSNLSKWINEYFRSSKEITLNWSSQVEDWSKSQYQPIFRNTQALIKYQFYRDIFGQLFVEIPFLINTSLVILGVFQGYLTISQMFVWVGISQFIISASNAFMENRVNADKKNTIKDKIVEIKRDIIGEQVGFVSPCDLDTLTVKLLDGSENTLTKHSGLHHISGANGSGKTTLINSIIGYEREIITQYSLPLREFFSNYEMDSFRIIERNSLMFDSLSGFKEQIVGPSYSDSKDLYPLIESNMKNIIDSEPFDRLMKIFRSIESQYNAAPEKPLSSGQMVLVSFMRVLASWNDNVRILVVDECSAFLDETIKKEFVDCITKFSKHVAVYLIANEMRSQIPASAELMKILN